jgi:hypothetical protein
MRFLDRGVGSTDRLAQRRIRRGEELFSEFGAKAGAVDRQARRAAREPLLVRSRSAQPPPAAAHWHSLGMLRDSGSNLFIGLNRTTERPTSVPTPCSAYQVSRAAGRGPGEELFSEIPVRGARW